MRRTTLISALLFLGLVGCQYDTDISDDDLGHVELESIGGNLANGQAHYEALAAITVVLPDDVSEGTRYCTGVLIEDKTVMTSARCLSDNLEAELNPLRPDDTFFLDPLSVIVQFGASSSAGTEYYLDATFNEVNTTKGLTMHRYYDLGARATNDIALLRLSESPGITPVAIQEDPLDASFVGMPLELVGYGKADADADNAAFTVRRVISPMIVEVNSNDILAGDPTLNTCYADGGGPGFIDFNGTPKVVSVTGIPLVNSDCSTIANRQRVDRYAELFIAPFVKRFSDPCVGAECGCEYNGTCVEDCPTRDWDCEIGVFTGGGCTADGECEEGGHCIAATDDPSFSYCSKPCGALGNSCPGEMVCGDANECIYDGISPGSQGAACTLAADCRSNYCESSFCAYECDIASANACDEVNGFFCLPAEDGVNVCRLDVATGGGGFCNVSPSNASRTRTTFLACFGFLFLAGMIRRRRRTKH